MHAWHPCFICRGIWKGGLSTDRTRMPHGIKSVSVRTACGIKDRHRQPADIRCHWQGQAAVWEGNTLGAVGMWVAAGIMGTCRSLSQEAMPDPDPKGRDVRYPPLVMQASHAASPPAVMQPVTLPETGLPDSSRILSRRYAKIKRMALQPPSFSCMPSRFPDIFRIQPC